MNPWPCPHCGNAEGVSFNDETEEYACAACGSEWIEWRITARLIDMKAGRSFIREMQMYPVAQVAMRDSNIRDLLLEIIRQTEACNAHCTALRNGKRRRYRSRY
jgi:hypothetical protein